MILYCIYITWKDLNIWPLKIKISFFTCFYFLIIGSILISKNFTCLPVKIVRLIAIFGLKCQERCKVSQWIQYNSVLLHYIPQFLEELEGCLERLNTPKDSAAYYCARDNKIKTCFVSVDSWSRCDIGNCLKPGTGLP